MQIHSDLMTKTECRATCCRASDAILAQSRNHVIRGASTISQLIPHFAQLTSASRHHFPASITLPFLRLISCCHAFDLLLLS